MTLAFGVSATIGSLRYDTHLTILRITLGMAPSAGSATMVLPPSVRIDAEVDDEVEVSLQGERDSVPVFGGVVQRVDFGVDCVAIVAVDALGRLAGTRPGRTYEQQSAGNVIRGFGSDLGLSVDVGENGPDLLSYVADQGRTALEHAARLASWSGAYAVGEADGSLAVKAVPSGPADRALRYGREIIALQVRGGATQPDVVWAGSGPAGNVSAPTAHLQTTGVLPDGAPAPAARSIRRAAPALRTPSAASDAISATATRNAARRATVTCWLQPEIRPGTLLEIADAPMPDGLGPWFVTSVVHELGPGPRGSTRLAAEQLGDGGGLLGQLLGALGGLL
jgi:hypothetical protein